MKFWREHFEERVKIFGDSPFSQDHKDYLSFHLTQRNLQQLIGNQGTLSILDVGCGTGLMVEPLLPQNWVVGIDQSFTMLLLAKKKGIKVLRGEAEHLPFKDSVFDVVLGIGLLQYIEEEKMVISEMVRVLKEEGRIILTLLNAQSWLRKIIKKGGWEKLPLRLYTIKDIKNILLDLGIQQFFYRYFLFPLPFTLCTGRFLLPLVTTFLIGGVKVCSD